MTIRGRTLAKMVEAEMAERIERRTTWGEALVGDGSEPDDPAPPAGDDWTLEAAAVDGGVVYWFWARHIQAADPEPKM